jgi:hypothetical protein
VQAGLVALPMLVKPPSAWVHAELPRVEEGGGWGQRDRTFAIHGDSVRCDCHTVSHASEHWL